MISSKKISEIARKFGKKISRKAKEKLEKEVLLHLEVKIKKSARNADFAGRKVIKEEDLEET